MGDTISKINNMPGERNYDVPMKNGVYFDIIEVSEAAGYLASTE